MITEKFSDVWPKVSAELTETLRAKGVPASYLDDLLQEVATRALQRQVPFTDADDLARWCYVVAWRLNLDERRRIRRIDPSASPDTVEPDIEQQVIARLRLARVRDAMALLPERHRVALRATGEGEERRVAVKLSVRRHRARAALLHMVEGAAAFLVLLWRGRRPASVALALPAVVAVVLLVPNTDGERAIDSRPAPPVRLGAELGPTWGSQPIQRSGTPETPSPRPWVTRHQVDLSPTPDHPLVVEIIEPAERRPLVCVERNLLLGNWCSPL